MNKYQIGQDLIRIDTTTPVFVTVKDIWHISSMRDPIYIFENNSGTDESYLCTIEELKMLYKELNTLCANCSDHLSKMLQDGGIFAKLFNIENFLCELGEL
jgi:hypothetical protein